VGGNAIAFARQGHFARVFAIEKDPETMKCAKHNAEIYGVENKIVWITGDCFEIISKRFNGTSNTVIFASPPWGGEYFITRTVFELLIGTGTTYTAENVFDLNKMEPYNLEALYKSYSKISKCIVLYLPRNSDLNQLAQYAPEDKKMDVAHYCLRGASKVGYDAPKPSSRRLTTRTRRSAHMLETSTSAVAVRNLEASQQAANHYGSMTTRLRIFCGCCRYGLERT
jgi:trimethylguanosine synthase